MNDDHLDELQAKYKSSVEAWIASIREEEALVSSADHSVTEIDRWEGAHFKEDGLRDAVKTAKREYEDALRTKFFAF